MIEEYHKKITKYHAVLILGENHKGAWANTEDTNDAIQEIIDWHKEKNLHVTCWYEGEDEPSTSFKAFMKYLKQKNPSVRTQMKSWEPSFTSTTNKEEAITVCLLAGDADAFEKQLGRGIFIDELLKSRKWFPSSFTAKVTKKDIEDIVSKGIHKDRYLHLLNQKITRPVLNEWFDLREEAFENPSSKLYKIMSKPQEKRERKVSALMKTKSGIYLIGDGHIPEMRRRNLLP